MQSKVGKYEKNLTVGPIFTQLIIYALPLMATNILQLLFNFTDVMVLGIAGYDVGSVGATNALINLIIGLFVGLSVSANVLVARFVGSGEKDRAEKVVGMSMLIAVVVGVVLAVVGFFCARIFLSWMACPSNLLDDATTYMQISFLGMPIILLYNFCASIMRAVGDTLRPLIYLVIAGIFNVGLNFMLTYWLRLGVVGVAVATVTSQLISVTLALVSIIRSKGYAHLDFKKIRIFKAEFLEMLKIGLPAGLQGCLFSLSNVVIQSSVNSFGDVAVNGNTIASQFDGLIYNATDGISLSCMAFVSQNLGAKKIDRIKRTVWQSLLVSTVVGIITGSIVLLLLRPVASIMTDNPAEVEYAWNRAVIVSTTHFICGLMYVMSNTMRGLGKSTSAMVVCLSGSCLFRILWVNTVCRFVNTPAALYWVYPVSWVLTFAIFLIMYFPTLKRVSAKLNASVALTTADITAIAEADGKLTSAVDGEAAKSCDNSDANADA